MDLQFPSYTYILTTLTVLLLAVYAYNLVRLVKRRVESQSKPGMLTIPTFKTSLYLLNTLVFYNLYRLAISLVLNIYYIEGEIVHGVYDTIELEYFTVSLATLLLTLGVAVVQMVIGFYKSVKQSALGIALTGVLVVLTMFQTRTIIITGVFGLIVNIFYLVILKRQRNRGYAKDI